jgi:hypothetical protein
MPIFDIVVSMTHCIFTLAGREALYQITNSATWSNTTAPVGEKRHHANRLIVVSVETME